MCAPAGKEEVVNVAAPPDSVPVPMLTPPSKNVTVPVGVPKPGVVLTVAVNVTDWPNTEVLVDATMVAVVLAPFTVWTKAVDAEAAWKWAAI
jgi:hypothetical protein